jgi:hypothetical protein
MNQVSLTWLAITCFSIMSASLVIYYEGVVHPVLRFLIVAWFLIACPGMAYIRMLRLNDRLSSWVLTIALSLALDGLVAMTLVFTGLWSVEIGVIALITITLLGLGLEFIAEVRHEPA